MVGLLSIDKAAKERESPLFQGWQGRVRRISIIGSGKKGRIELIRHARGICRLAPVIGIEMEMLQSHTAFRRLWLLPYGRY